MTRQRLNSIAFFGAAGLLAAGIGGCAGHIDFDRPHEDRHVVVEEHRTVVEQPAPVIVERGGVYRHGRGAFLVAEGHQKKKFTAPQYGVVTVVDTHNGKVEVQKAIRRGDELTFDPDHNKAWINDHKILDHDLNSHHVYQMWFEPR